MILNSLAKTDYSDAYSVLLPVSPIIDVRTAAQSFFECAPKWVIQLMQFRDTLVGLIGLKTHAKSTQKPDFTKVNFKVGENYGLFEIKYRSPTEIIMGADDKHLNFRVSIMVNQTPELKQQLVMATVVDIHNKFGATYFKIIAPFHQLVVKSFIKKMAIILTKTT
jgi:hypothetical protein